MRSFVAIGSAILSALMVGQSLGQSSFEFRTLDFGVDAPVYDAFGTPLEGPGYLAELWGAPSADSLSPVVRASDQDVRLILPFVSGGYILPHLVGASSGVIVPNAPPGSAVGLQMRAWDASLGSTYEEVAALGLGGYGESKVFFGVGGNPTLPTVASPLIGLESFSLRAVIPEPSTWALFALGALAALVFRRVSGRFKTRRRLD